MIGNQSNAANLAEQISPSKGTGNVCGLRSVLYSVPYTNINQETYSKRLVSIIIRVAVQFHYSSDPLFDYKAGMEMTMLKDELPSIRTQKAGSLVLGRVSFSNW